MIIFFSRSFLIWFTWYSSQETLAFKYSLCVQFAKNCKCDHNKCYKGDLVACTNQCSEHHRMDGWSEHVAVNLLPTVLITEVPFLQPNNHVILRRVLTFLSFYRHFDDKTCRVISNNENLRQDYYKIIILYLNPPFHLGHLLYCIVHNLFSAFSWGSLIPDQPRKWPSWRSWKLKTNESAKYKESDCILTTDPIRCCA